MRLMRDRKIMALLLIVPFCLILDRYKIYHPNFINLFPKWASALVVIGVAAIFLLIRKLFAWQLRPKRMRDDMYFTAQRSTETYFILLCMVLFPTILGLTIAQYDDLTIRKIAIYEIAFMYALFILRKTQIYFSYCNPFTTFLYLCTLEFLPMAMIIASAILL